MWARVIEFMLGCWLAISPFIFGYTSSMRFFFGNDFICAFLIGFLSLICYYKKFRKMHLFNVLIAFYLIALGYTLDINTHYAMVQNYMVFGLILMLVAIVPTRANDHPYSWKQFYDIT